MKNIILHSILPLLLSLSAMADVTESFEAFPGGPRDVPPLMVPTRVGTEKLSIQERSIMYKNFEQAVNATVVLKDLDQKAKTSTCMGTLTSMSGYVVTAAHCISLELKRLGLLKMVNGYAQPTTDVRGMKFTFRDKNLKSYEAELIYVASNSPFGEHSTEAAAGEVQDFAVLKILNHTGASCALPGNSFKRMGDRTWSLGTIASVPDDLSLADFDLKGAENLAFDSKKIQFNATTYPPEVLKAYLNFLNVYNNTSGDWREKTRMRTFLSYGRYVKNDAGLIDLFPDLEPFRNRSPVFYQDNFAVTTTAVVGGFSGGPVFDVEGKMIGIISSSSGGYMSATINGVNVGSAFQRIEFVQAQLKKALGPQMAAQIFNCPLQ